MRDGVLKEMKFQGSNLIWLKKRRLKKMATSDKSVRWLEKMFA